MAQRQWRSDDTDKWSDNFGGGSSDVTKSSNETASLANATCTGTAGTKSLSLGAASSFQNDDIVIIHQTQKASGAGVWELNKIVSGGGSTSLTMKYDLMNTYTTGAQIVGFVKAKNFTINTGVTVTVPAWNGSIGGIYPVIANGDISIVGSINGVGANGSQSNTSINGNGGGFRGGHGGNDSGYNKAGQGEGETGLGGDSRSANGSSGGGGEGGAGAGIAGTAYQTDASLKTHFVFGGSGGGGHTNGSGSGSQGGNGGAIVFLIGKTITVSGSINVTGGNGTNGTTNGPSGGGGGGSILLKGKTITLGSSLIYSNGGSGGSSGGGDQGGGGAGSLDGSGKSGNVGRIHADYSTSITGTTTPTIDSTQDATIIESSTISGSGSFLMNFV